MEKYLERITAREGKNIVQNENALCAKYMKREKKTQKHRKNSPFSE